jgi:hypothetical protein
MDWKKEIEKKILSNNEHPIKHFSIDDKKIEYKNIV